MMVAPAHDRRANVGPGTKLGPYEITSPLGAGGMGEVYRARDTRLGRTVAIKVLPQQLSQMPELERHLNHEARAIARLSHPNICALHDIGHKPENLMVSPEAVKILDFGLAKLGLGNEEDATTDTTESAQTQPGAIVMRSIFDQISFLLAQCFTKWQLESTHFKRRPYQKRYRQLFKRSRERLGP